MGNGRYAIETIDLTKVFKVREAASVGRSLSPLPFLSSCFRKTGRVVAVNGLNIQVRRGQLFGLLGPNGAGKTTTVKMLSTLILPTEGTARVNGYDILRQESKVKDSIGLVFGRERQLYWRTSGRFNLEFTAAMYGLDEKEAEERIDGLIDLLGLAERQHDLVMHYSTGMKQRLSLARGLLADPPILLMDEPTQGLDPRAARDVRSFIANDMVRREGKTVFLTTHIMQEADTLCDNVAIIDRGELIALGSPEELKRAVERDGEIEGESATMDDVFIHYTGREFA